MPIQIIMNALLNTSRPWVCKTTVQHSQFPKLAQLKAHRGCRLRTFQCNGFQLHQDGWWAERLPHATCPCKSPTGELAQDSSFHYLFNVSDFQLFAGSKKFMATSSVNMLMTSLREERQSKYIAITVLGWTNKAALKPLALLPQAFAFLLSNCLPPGI